jgi:hypothetical protein
LTISIRLHTPHPNLILAPLQIDIEEFMVM